MMLPLVNSSEESDLENEDRLGRGRSTSGYTTDEEETEDRFRATSLARSFTPSSSFSSPSSIVSIPLKVLSPNRHQHGKPVETEDEEDVSVSVSPPSSSSSSSTQLDQEEEIRHLWTMDKWRWWPKRIRARYRFYPWSLGLRRFFAHGWALFFFPVILLLILLLVYLVPAQTTLSTFISADCLIVDSVREVYKHSIFGNRWRDVLSVNFVDEGDEEHEATVYVCHSFEPENYECSRMFSVNGTFDCLYNPENESNVVGAFDANKLAHGVAVTTGMAPTLLFFFLLLIGLPFYSCSRECENAVHFLKDAQFTPLSSHSSLPFPSSSSSSSSPSPSLRLKEPSSTSPHYTELNGLDLITESSSSYGFYLPYVEAALERHNKRLRDMVIQMEIESAIEPHPIASRAVDDADSYVDKMFDTSQIEETILSVIPNDPLPVTYPWTKFLGFLALSLVVAIVAWFAASWKNKPENAGAVDILDLTKTLYSCFGVGCFFFLTTWLILLLLLMQFNYTGWGTGLTVKTNRREMKLEGGRTMLGFFGVFVEMSPLNEDYQRLKSRVTPLKFQEFVPRTSSLLNIQAYAAEMNAEEP